MIGNEQLNVSFSPTFGQNREATMLYYVLLRHRYEYNASNAMQAGTSDDISVLRNKIIECGGTEYLKKETEAATIPNTDRLYDYNLQARGINIRAPYLEIKEQIKDVYEWWLDHLSYMDEEGFINKEEEL